MMLAYDNRRQWLTQLRVIRELASDTAPNVHAFRMREEQPTLA